MNSFFRWAGTLLITIALSGCGLIYTNIHSPLSYRTTTPGEVPHSPNDETVTGKACDQSLLYLVSWGNASYAAAARDALKGRQGVVLYDVKADLKAQAYVLGLYTQVCTLLTGKVAKL